MDVLRHPFILCKHKADDIIQDVQKKEINASNIFFVYVIHNVKAFIENSEETKMGTSNRNLYPYICKYINAVL